MGILKSIKRFFSQSKIKTPEEIEKERFSGKIESFAGEVSGGQFALHLLKQKYPNKFFNPQKLDIHGTKIICKPTRIMKEEEKWKIKVNVNKRPVEYIIILKRK